MANIKLCSVITLIALVVMLILVIQGFRYVINPAMADKDQNVNDLVLIQRQLKGFGYLALSTVVAILAGVVCNGAMQSRRSMSVYE